MPRIDVRMPSPEGVAAGQTATFKLPIGRRYHELQLAYSGATLAQLDNIRLFANGKPIHRYTGPDRDEMNQFDRRAAAAGILTIPLDRYGLKTRAGEEESGIHTGVALDDGTVINSLYLEVDINGAAVNPALSMNATQSESIPGARNMIMHVMRQTRDAAGSGEFDIADLPYGKVTSQYLNRVFFKPSANDISEIKVERDTRTLFQRSKALNELKQTDGVRTPQAGWHSLDRTEQGYGGDPMQLIGASDFRYILTMTGAAAVTVYSEVFGVLGD